MPTRDVPDKFRVAFSLAGEQRDLVRSIAEAVEQELGSPSVFLDEWFEHYIAGDDADLTLQEIYGQRCDLVVVCISERYGGKPWTLAEHAAIRARVMKARESGDKHGVLPIRVGEGDVEGILFNTIVPDVRDRSIAEAARLIIDRLHLILPDVGTETSGTPDWPEQPPLLKWPIADHSQVRAAFERLLTCKTSYRFLPLRGPSESGKSYITRQMLGNALRMTDLACGRFDFKGTTDMDDEVRAFIQQLDVSPIPASPRLNERLSHVLDSLKQRAQPALLIFDTYEAAGEAEEWAERHLLPSLFRNTWLRVVIAGQRVPKVSGAMWEANATAPITLKPPPPADWFAYGKQHRPELTLEFVETACGLTNKATVLSQLLGPET